MDNSAQQFSGLPTIARWYHPKISGTEATRLLTEAAMPGTFLVRKSESIPGQLVLSAWTEESEIAHMKRDPVTNKMENGDRSFDDLISFVEFYHKSGEFINNQGATFRLKFPINLTDFCISDVAGRVTDLRQNGDRGFAEEFDALQREHFIKSFPREEGQRPENKTKNRYPNILPHDDTRVVLRGGDDDIPGSSYINASYIQCRHDNSSSSEKGYIAAQTCLPNTQNDFWHLVYQENCHLIVTISHERERNKCPQYWPDVGCDNRYGRIVVKNVFEEQIRGAGKEVELVSREFEITNDGLLDGPRRIYHYTFVAWPDHGVPANPRGFLNFIHRIADRRSKLTNSGPIIVHCSSGIGRTGTFIVADMLIKKILNQGLDCEIDVFHTIVTVRRDRPGLVQTEQQYKFIYNVLFHYFNETLLPRALAGIKTSDAVGYENVPSPLIIHNLPSVSSYPSDYPIPSFLSSPPLSPAAPKE